MKNKFTVTITNANSKVVGVINIQEGTRPDPNDIHDDNVYEDEIEEAIDAFKDQMQYIMK